MNIKPIYVIQNGIAVLDTSQICADGKYIAVPADQQNKVFSGLPQTADPLAVSQNQNFHTISGMTNNNKPGIMTADLAGYNVPVRAEVANPTGRPQKFKVTLDATAATEEQGDYFYVSLGGGLKCQRLLNLPALPVTVTIGGVDGADTVSNANDFAQNGWQIKGLQIDASSANLFNADGAPVQFFTLPDETTKQLIISEFDVTYNISDQSFNLTQRKFYEGSGAREFAARLSKMEGIILGVARGTRVTYTMTLFSSANSAAIYKLD
jgi:hypothetical protein